MSAARAGGFEIPDGNSVLLECSGYGRRNSRSRDKIGHAASECFELVEEKEPQGDSASAELDDSCARGEGRAHLSRRRWAGSVEGSRAVDVHGKLIKPGQGNASTSVNPLVAHSSTVSSNRRRPALAADASFSPSSSSSLAFKTRRLSPFFFSSSASLNELHPTVVASIQPSARLPRPFRRSLFEGSFPLH